MARTRFRADHGLSTRMVLVMFLMGALYVAFVVFLMWVGINPALVLIIAGGLLFAQYFWSDKLALASMRAVEVTPEQAPELHAIIDRLCVQADMPKPRVAIADSDIPNAFATGRNPKNAVVCATTGILRRLNNEELEGVLAHELSHVAHRDVAVMTLASFLGVLAGFLTRSMMWGSVMGGGRDRNDNGGAVGLLVVMVVSLVVYAISFVLIRTLSRYRELAADRAGAQLTGKPSQLAAALVKVTGDMGQIPTKDLRAAEPMNAFFFAPAFKADMASMFSTHPPLEKRLEQLSKLSAELGQPS